MAKYNFDVSGSQLIVSLIPVESDVQPTSMSYLAPSFKIGNNKINAYEYGQPKQSFLFTEIGEIDGVAPTDLQDAFDKITTATANFSGGGSAPTYKVYTALLSQSGTDEPTAVVVENTLEADVTYSYIAAGQYVGTSIGMLPDDKIIECKGFVRNFDDLVLSIEKLDEDSFRISSTGFDRLGADNLLYGQESFEIRVYN
jgi:hypothetical protein